MIKIDPALARHSFKYGAITAAFTIFAFVVFYYIGQQPWHNLISFILEIVIVGVFLFMAIKEFRTMNHGELRFYHGMTVGFIDYLSAAVLFSLFYFIFIKWIEPGFLDNYILLAQEDLMARKEMLIAALDEETFNTQYNLVSETSAGLLVLDALIKRVLIGLVITPVFSIILRTPQR